MNSIPNIGKFGFYKNLAQHVKCLMLFKNHSTLLHIHRGEPGGPRGQQCSIGGTIIIFKNSRNVYNFPSCSCQ